MVRCRDPAAKSRRHDRPVHETGGRDRLHCGQQMLRLGARPYQPGGHGNGYVHCRVHGRARDHVPGHVHR